MKRMLSLLVCLCLTLGICACGQKEPAPTWQEQYDLGVRYLSEGKYEEAILAFAAAIEIDPKRPEGYKKLAEAYMAVGDEESARQVLEEGLAATGDETLTAWLAELLEAAESEATAPVTDEAYEQGWQLYKEGVAAYLNGDNTQALELLDSAVSIFQTSSACVEVTTDGEWNEIALFCGAAARVCYAMGDSDAMLKYFALAEAYMYLGPPYYNNGCHGDWGGINVAHPVNTDTGEVRGAIYTLFKPREDRSGDPEVLIEFHFDEYGKQIVYDE